jgi:hypothetical protein
VPNGNAGGQETCSRFIISSDWNDRMNHNAPTGILSNTVWVIYRSMWIRWPHCWMSIWFTKYYISEYLATGTQSKTWLQSRLSDRWFGQYWSVTGNRFGIFICQVCWWQLEFSSPQLVYYLQKLSYGIWQWTKSFLGCQCQLYGGIHMLNKWV